MAPKTATCVEAYFTTTTRSVDMAWRWYEFYLFYGRKWKEIIIDDNITACSMPVTSHWLKNLEMKHLKHFSEMKIGNASKDWKWSISRRPSTRQSLSFFCLLKREKTILFPVVVIWGFGGAAVRTSVSPLVSCVRFSLRTHDTWCEKNQSCVFFRYSGFLP